MDPIDYWVVEFLFTNGIRYLAAGLSGSSCLRHRIFLLFGASERGRTQGGPWKSRESAHREGPTVHSQSTNDISTTWRTTLRLFVSAACTLPAFKGCMGTVCFKKHWSSGEVGLPVHYTYDFCK